MALQQPIDTNWQWPQGAALAGFVLVSVGTVGYLICLSVLAWRIFSASRAPAEGEDGEELLPDEPRRLGGSADWGALAEEARAARLFALAAIGGLIASSAAMLVGGFLIGFAG